MPLTKRLLLSVAGRDFHISVSGRLPTTAPLRGVYDVHTVLASLVAHAGCLPYGYDVASASGAG
jgi:hypothetical protein